MCEVLRPSVKENRRGGEIGKDEREGMGEIIREIRDKRINEVFKKPDMRGI